MSPRYELFADDVSVWISSRLPTQDYIDRAAIAATKRGWNGTVLELYCDAQFRKEVYPSHEALAE